MRRHEEAWPVIAVSAAAAVALLAGLLAGVLLWTSTAFVYYAFP